MTLFLLLIQPAGPPFAALPGATVPALDDAEWKMTLGFLVGMIVFAAAIGAWRTLTGNDRRKTDVRIESDFVTRSELDTRLQGLASEIERKFERALHDEERARGAAVIVQVGALAGEPGEQPDVSDVVTVQPAPPASGRVEAGDGAPLGRALGHPLEGGGELRGAERRGLRRDAVESPRDECHEVTVP